MNGWIVVIKNVTVETNSRMLGFLHQDGAMVSKTLKSENSTIIAPCFIDDDVVLNQCNSGPKCI
jgi:glucose-1-phosphate thymidylyltransferase